MYRMSLQFGALTELSYLAARLTTQGAPVQLPVRLKAEKLGLNPLHLVVTREWLNPDTGRVAVTVNYPLSSASLAKLWALSGRLPLLSHTSEAQRRPGT